MFQNLFSNQPASNSLFQPANNSLFGQQPVQNQPLFGGGAQPTQSLFTAAPQNMMQPTVYQNQQQPLFGNPQQQSPFGGQTTLFQGTTSSAAPQGTSTPLFGNAAPVQNNLFGQPQQTQATTFQQNSLFGQSILQPQQQQAQQQQQMSLFGNNTQSFQNNYNSSGGGALFPAQSTSSFFGQQQQSQTTTFNNQQSSFFKPATATTWNSSSNQPDDTINDFNLDTTCTKIDDSINQIVWNPVQNRFLAICTWEGKVRIYEIIQNLNQKCLQERKTFSLDPRSNGVPNPILCLDWKTDSSMIFIGCGLDYMVKAIDVNSGQMAVIGQHNGPVISIYWIESLSSVLSISTDQSLKLWDVRLPNQLQYQLSFSYKPLVSDFIYPLLIIGFAQERFALIDVTQLTIIRTVNYIESPLGHYSQITSIALFPTKDGFGIGSIDGRGHMSNIYTRQGSPNTYDIQNIMTFKAHKIEEQANGKTNNYFYPVNCVQFNIRNNKFLMTAGSEGSIIFWDYNVKNKIRTFNCGQIPITAAKISHDGSMLAYSLGYDYSKGPDGYNANVPNKLCVHLIPDNELKCNSK